MQILSVFAPMPQNAVGVSLEAANWSCLKTCHVQSYVNNFADMLEKLPCTLQNISLKLFPVICTSFINLALFQKFTVLKSLVVNFADAMRPDETNQYRQYFVRDPQFLSLVHLEHLQLNHAKFPDDFDLAFNFPNLRHLSAFMYVAQHGLQAVLSLPKLQCLDLQFVILSRLEHGTVHVAVKEASLLCSLSLRKSLKKIIGYARYPQVILHNAKSELVPRCDGVDVRYATIDSSAE